MRGGSGGKEKVVWQDWGEVVGEGIVRGCKGFGLVPRSRSLAALGGRIV